MGRGISPETNGGANLGSASQQWGTVYTQNVVDSANLGNNYSLGYRQPSTEYSIGDIKYTNALATGKKLVCLQEGTTGSGDLTLSSTAEGSITTDGTVVWAVDSLADGNYSAGHHNGTYREADITAYFDSGLMSANISAGNFANIYPGDFITKTLSLSAINYTEDETTITADAVTFNNLKFLVAGCDYGYESINYIDTNYSFLNKHHIVLISSQRLRGNIKMNFDETAFSGGYLGTPIWKAYVPNFNEGIENAFGVSHVLEHTEGLTNTDTNETATVLGTGYVFSPVKSNIVNIKQLLGISYLINDSRLGGDKQFPLFKISTNIRINKNFFNNSMITRSIYDTRMLFYSAWQELQISSAWDTTNDDAGLYPYFFAY